MKLKKIIALIIATITAACIAVGFSGCKEEIKLPPMTAEAPIVTTREDMSAYKDFHRESMVVGAYDVFMDYYNSEFKQVYTDKFYLLNTNLVEPEERRWFSVRDYGIYIMIKTESETEIELINPVIYERFSLYDDHLGDSRNNGSIAPWSINFRSYFLPVQEEVTELELSLEFGKFTQDKNYNYYINLYKGKACIGTCYFETNVSVSLEWFEDFFTRHLVYGG